MKQRIILLFSGFLAWTLFFIVARALFLIYHSQLTSDLSVTDIFLVFFHGIRMDFSMAGYFSLLPGLVFGLFSFADGKKLWPFWFSYNAVVLFVACFIIVLDFELYKHWGFRLDATPIMYLGKEAAQSGDLGKSLLLIFFWLLLYSAALFSLYKYFKSRFLASPKTSWKSAPVLIIITAMFIVPIRGSFGVAPMNTGFVYFHDTNVFANHAAVNVVWNFAYAVQKMNRLKYSDSYFDREKTEKYFQELFPTPDSTKHLLRIKKPNIVIIMLESYTSGLIEPLGGEAGVTPNFNALIKEGILFDHFYSSGDRTDKGIVSVLNGYPSQPVTSMVKEPKKTLHLPYLNKVFKANGYRTEFTYGYNINYANFNSYLLHGEFDHITHSMDFPQELNTSKWGVHDQYVFQ
jgi:phosphoglycerol transferase MdoB-like AlkP superfamily enzyme